MITQIISLLQASVGEEYTINHIKSEGSLRSNLSGYGLTPGAKIKPVFSSPSKNPRAYEVMGAVIALRNEDAQNIFII